jgi:type III pantothenate kinase
VKALLVDVGNSRIKWAHYEGGRLGRHRAAVHTRWRAADYARRILGGKPPPTHMLIASVAGREVDRRLAAAARGHALRATFITVPRSAGGVTVGYADPWRLGVDRFVAAVGAHRLFPGVALCVVGVGTAMTLDLVDGAGRHRGGVIIPAPALMVRTLLEQTHGIRRRAQGGARGGRDGLKLFGRSTRDGIEQGARYAGAALIDRAVEEARVLLGREPLAVLTGGEAGRVRPLLKSRGVGIPDLVLRGLAVLAEARGA